MLPRLSTVVPRRAPVLRARLAPSFHSSSSSSSSLRSTMARGPVETSIQSKLEAALSPAVLEITNDSSKHRHHAPMRALGGGDGESHFTVEIVSDRFEGMRVIQRHRLVNDALKQEFAAGLHALAIKAKSPSEFEAAGGSLP
ncbi:hypothetical protein JCM11491_001353 [Sporobolomyces phaffii]